MKSKRILAGLAVCALVAAAADSAQVKRPYRNGSVWTIAFIQVKTGMDSAYKEYMAGPCKSEQEAKKKAALKQVKDGFETILRYEIGETTAAASYYLAEMYYDFNRSLMESQRPRSLRAAEKEQYELALEEQAYPFEEKAIDVHQKNTDLVKLGIYNKWVEKSFTKLARLVPARYAKFEESSGYVETFNRLVFDKLTERREPAVVASATPPQAKEQASEGVQK